MFYGQLELENQILPAANKILFCDTTILTVKIWCDFTFGNSPQEVLNKLPLHPYDFYLLMDIDLPWQEDPLRDFPHMREHFMDIWHHELQALNASYVVVSGNDHQRLINSVSAVDRYLQSAL
jgi:nicotinamide riboside kinase